MARNIKLNNEVLKTPLEELIADLYTDNAIQLKFPKPNVKIEKRPKLQFTAETFTQMTYLIKQCSEEIGWLGRVIRDDLTFTIDKLYVFPQLVTGASVTPNETKYVHWNMQLSNDEIKACKIIKIKAGKKQFQSMEQAIDWVINNTGNKSSESPAKRENIAKKITNAINNNQSYCGMKWRKICQ